MASKPDKTELAQETRPYGKDDEGKPTKPETIPVPTRGEFLRGLQKLVGGKPPHDSARE